MTMSIRNFSAVPNRPIENVKIKFQGKKEEDEFYAQFNWSSDTLSRVALIARTEEAERKHREAKGKSGEGPKHILMAIGLGWLDPAVAQLNDLITPLTKTRVKTRNAMKKQNPPDPKLQQEYDAATERLQDLRKALKRRLVEGGYSETGHKVDTLA